MPTPLYLRAHADQLHLAETLAWNFPEQKRGHLAIVGGNASAFATEVKIASYAATKFSFLANIINVFPDSLRKNLPALPNLAFLPANASGSFAKSPELSQLFAAPSELLNHQPVDFVLYLGDFSKNSETAIAIAEALKRAPAMPALLTRDTVDLLAPEAASFIDRPNLTLVASLAQLQKLLRALYYPKMLLLTQPLLPTLEVLHKFTLSYPLTILTYHTSDLIVAQNGQIYTFPLAKSEYSPISLWSGELALKIAVFQLFNPSKLPEAALAGISY